MTPIPKARTYCNWDAVHRVLETIPLMVADGGYTPAAMAVMTVIAKHVNNENGVSLAAYDTFLAEAGIPQSTLKRTLKHLVQAGYLTHAPGTYSYELGPQVQTFSADTSTADQSAKKLGKHTTAARANAEPGWAQLVDHK